VHEDTIAVALAEAGLRGEVRDYGNIGQEPVRHVRNIYNYYIAYDLPEEYRHATETIKQTGTIHP
jgi:hypothetical protein